MVEQNSVITENSSHIFLDPEVVNLDAKLLSPEQSTWALQYWQGLVHADGHNSFSEVHGVIKQREAEGQLTAEQSAVLFAQYRSNLLVWLSRIAPMT